MSETCPKCEKSNSQDLYNGFRHCRECCNIFPEELKCPTVFDHITKSEEALAEEFVDSMYDRVACEYRYYSMLTAEFYNSRAEAIAATLEELKQEYKNA